MPNTAVLPPIHKSITVPWDRQHAFDRFTRDIATWWPLRTHSLGLERAETVVFERRVGGQIRESIQGGDQTVREAGSTRGGPGGAAATDVIYGAGGIRTLVGAFRAPKRFSKPPPSASRPPLQFVPH